jgi:hypothetical protein
VSRAGLELMPLVLTSAVEHGEWHLRSVLRLGRSHCTGPPNPSRPSAGAPVLGRCFVMESLEVAERVPPEQEIHV